MFHLVLSACLVASPETCAQRLLPAGDAAERQQCEQRAGPIARDWLARHTEMKGGKMACVETADLPALSVREIADDVYTHQGTIAQISPQNQGRIANLSFVVGDSVAVIDAGGSRAEGEALYAAIRRVTDAPISHVILTHMHPDHILGSEVFSEAGATIVADARLPEAVAQRSQAWMVSIPRQIGAGAFAGTHIIGVDQKISEPTTIPLGSTELRLTPQPSAHTDNDLTVFDTESATLFTGDLLFRGLTPSLDGSLAGWLNWLATPPQPEPALIVPGHGPVAESWDEASAPTIQYLTQLRDMTRKAVSGGMALSQAIPAITQMMKPYSEGWADFAATTARNAATAYSQLEWE
ncbi:quinoprotein relay system zinc metallohydrolase 2 [Paracoccus laeviglucosivorans]|uniref:Quinoprotein relay system zinc metallohydrolase 2 n=1 Tax=Paracoccus laeviglucosivorans TaxID=1197861 RepID=A0A521DPK5_9RHOB|nr:quinoprotein relay system zinc metallohydrolase 2 [Paracoccus laeviglucosivorans]SMO73532.1 quinoprotein relay system zinc metallohydrolase 2 [Paracoccus laeviglucosivorans]